MVLVDIPSEKMYGDCAMKKVTQNIMNASRSEKGLRFFHRSYERRFLFWGDAMKITDRVKFTDANRPYVERKAGAGGEMKRVLWDRDDDTAAVNYDGTAPEILEHIVIVKELGCNCVNVFNEYPIGPGEQYYWVVR